MPFLFKNKQNGKYISFQKNSSTYDGKPLTLTECKECDDNTILSDMPDSSTSEYMIKLGNNCIAPNENNELINKNCNGSLDEVYVMKKLNNSYMDQNLPSFLRVSIGFNDNATSNINNNSNNWGKEMTVESHQYVSNETKTNSDIYNILKDPEMYINNNKVNNPKIKDYLTENIEIRCKIIHVIDEYNSRKELVKKTTYRMKYKPRNEIPIIQDNSVIGAFIFEINDNNLSSSGQNDTSILYYGKESYQEEHINDINRVNFSRAYIGAVLSENNVSYGYVDTNEFYGGLIIKNNSNKKTQFRVIPDETIFNRMIKYSYPNTNIGEEHVNLNLSSYINPLKKMVERNSIIVSKNNNDGINTTNGVFNVIPVTENFSEGFSSLIEPIGIDYTISNEINTLNSLLDSNTSFEMITNKIDDILTFITDNNSGDEYAHIVNVYKRDMLNMKICFNIAKQIDSIIKDLYENMVNFYQKIGLNNIYGNQTNSNSGLGLGFNSSKGREMVSLFNSLNANLAATKQQFKNNYQMSLIEFDPDVLFILIDVFNYFNNYYGTIQKHVNAFFDYNNTQNNIEYLKTKTFLNIINFDSNEGFDYDNIININIGGLSLVNFIKKAESLKNRNKTFFDLNFGFMYDQLFVTAESDNPRQFVATRIEKILHKNTSIAQTFINAGNQQYGVMHYYLNFLITQKDYYKKFNELKSQKQNIEYFKNNFPANNIVSVMNFYSKYGKNLDPGDNSAFFQIMNNYSESINSSNSQEYNNNAFIILFSNLKYKKDTQSLTSGSIDYSDITSNNLYKYYETNYYINKKYEQDIITTFMSKCTALVDNISSGRSGEIVAVHGSSQTNNVEPFTPMRESFTSVITDGLANLHPSDPEIIDLSGLNRAFFNTAFKYSDDVSLGGYLSQYEGGQYTSTAGAICFNSGGIEEEVGIKFKYYCGETAVDLTGEADVTINNVFDETTHGSVTYDGCKTDARAYNINQSVILKTTATDADAITGTSNTILIDLVMTNNLTYATVTKRIHTLNLKKEHIEAFGDTTDGKQKLETNNTNNTMTYLKNDGDYLYSVDNDDTDQISNSYVRLYIKDNNVMLDYKLARGVEWDDGTSTYYAGLTIAEDNDTGDYKKIARIYDNTKDVKKTMEKGSIYIDSTGKSHNINNDILDTMNTDGAVYYDYGDEYCYNGTIPSVNADSNAGLINDNITIDKSHLKNIYHAPDGCVDGVGSINLKLKINEFKYEDYGACATNPADISMVSYDDFNTISGGNDFNNFSDAYCDRKHVFSGAISQFKQDRDDFSEVFRTMIEAFNILSESELEMLEETQSSIDSLKEIIKEYNELHDEATKKSELKTIVDAQNKDSNILVKNSQYNMALMGMGAIGATMIMFNYMKNS